MTELTTVRIAAGAGAFNWLPVFVAEKLGLFKQQGLQIDYVRLGAVGKATAAVREGSVDLAITPPEGAVTDYLDGGSLRVLAANSLRLPMSLVARPGLSDLTELRGARIGTSSLTEGTALYTQIALQRAGLFYPADYEFVLAGIHTARWLALQAGEIDCAPQPAPWNFLAERNGYRLLSELSDAIPEILFAAVIATADWAEGHRDMVERLLQVLAEAHELVNDPANDRVTQPIYQEITTPEAPDLAARGFAYTRDMGMWPPGLVVSPAALEATIDLMTRACLLAADQRTRATGVIDSSFLPTR
jgi:ABC-type nitrate/sulfonate/bicarbonate transport system substrate-binding protein